MVPLPSTQAPIPTWEKLPNMMERWPPLDAKASKSELTDPPLPTVSPAAFHGGTSLPGYDECRRSEVVPIFLAHSRAYLSS